MRAQSSDSQTLAGILQQVRELRQDLHGMTLVAQRVQILLYRAQLQGEAVKNAALRYDQVAAKLKDAESNRVGSMNAFKEAEERLAALQNQSERKAAEEVVQEMKRRLEMWSSEESSFRTAEVAASSDLRTEQAKLLELQQRLDKLERQLEEYAVAPAK